MSTRTFDRKFGDDFLGQVPSAPGVYRCFDASGELVYVGKALNLRRRLSQYRNATRKKAHAKMRRIVKETARIEVELADDGRQALLIEDTLIKAHRPRLNVAGAYSFLYPYVGLKRCDDGDLLIAYTTDVALLQAAELRPFGCYRNRTVARSGFDALVDVLERVGHRSPTTRRVKYTTWRQFRQIPSAWDAEIAALLAGDSEALVETAFMALLEKPSARRDAASVQEAIRSLKRFYEVECVRLGKLLRQVGGDYLTQDKRDAALIRAEA